MDGQHSDDDRRHRAALRFIDRCRGRLEAIGDSAQAGEGAAVLADALEWARPRPGQPSWVPVLDTIDRLTPSPSGDEAAGGADDPAAGGDGGLLADFVGLAPLLAWVPTPRADDGGTELALAPFDRFIDLGDTVVGLMYVGPGATYPLHRHPPQELYLTIAGDGSWRYGGHDRFRPVGPGRVLYNHPGDLHSAVAGAVPVVALYVLW